MVSEQDNQGGMKAAIKRIYRIDTGVMIINDNDGVDDNSGETQLMNLDNILN